MSEDGNLRESLEKEGYYNCKIHIEKIKKHIVESVFIEKALPRGQGKSQKEFANVAHIKFDIYIPLEYKTPLLSTHYFGFDKKTTPQNGFYSL